MDASRSLQSPWQPQLEHQRQTSCHQTWWSWIPGQAKDNARRSFVLASHNVYSLINNSATLNISGSTNWKFFFPVHKTPADNYPPTIWRMRTIYFSKVLNAHPISEKANYSWEGLFKNVVYDKSLQARIFWRKPFFSSHPPFFFFFQAVFMGTGWQECFLGENIQQWYLSLAPGHFIWKAARS